MLHDLRRFSNEIMERSAFSILLSSSADPPPFAPQLPPFLNVERDIKPANEAIPEDFQECAMCAAKPGSPTLCPACLHNRSLASKLRDARHFWAGGGWEWRLPEVARWRKVRAAGIRAWRVLCTCTKTAGVRFVKFARAAWRRTVQAARWVATLVFEVWGAGVGVAIDVARWARWRARKGREERQ